MAPGLTFVIAKIDSTALPLGDMLALGFGQAGAIGNRKKQTPPAPGKCAVAEHAADIDEKGPGPRLATIGRGMGNALHRTGAHLREGGMSFKHAVCIQPANEQQFLTAVDRHSGGFVGKIICDKAIHAPGLTLIIAVNNGRAGLGMVAK